jgi:hypothetical protein
MKFSNISHLQRELEIESKIGININVDNVIFLQSRAASDGNPLWRNKTAKAHAELQRLQNAGASPKQLQSRYAMLYADALIFGWHGGIDDDGNLKPGGPLDENGELVPFSHAACVSFLSQADDAVTAIDKLVFDTRNFRSNRASGTVDVLKND